MTNEDLDKQMRSAFEGNFLDATDILGLPNSRVTVEISAVVPPNTEKNAQGKVINKTILAFSKAQKRLICNQTNAKIIRAMYGDKASQWIGKPVTLCVQYLEKAFGQRNVPVIRVVPREDTPLTFGMRRNYGSSRPFTNDESR